MRDERSGPLPHQTTPTSDENHPPALDRIIQGRLGDHLRAFYDELMQEAVPDRFHDLIDRLSASKKPSQ